MSIYKGKLEARGTPANGGVVSKEKKLLCNITPIKALGELNVKVRWYNNLKGEMQKPSSFGMKVKELAVRYTFIAAFSRFFNKHFATMISAEAVTYEVDDAAVLSTEAPLQGCDAEEMQPKQDEVKLSLCARLVAYYRAPLQYIVNFFIERLSKLISVLGVVAVGRKHISIERVSEALEAKGVIASSTDSFICESEAEGITAPCDEMQADSTLIVEGMAEIESAATQETGFAESLKTTHMSKMCTWCEPVFVDGFLIIRQSYGANQIGDVLEVI